MKQIVNGATTLYLGDLVEVALDGTRTEYVYAGDQRIAQVTDDGATQTARWIHGDHLGSASVLTDETGAIASRLEYTPFGQVATSVGDTPEHTYTGQRSDAATGLMYYRARYYDPELGRFITPDTFVQSPADPQTLNRYSYVRNNPVKYVDPSGYDFTLGSLFKVITAAIIGVQAWFDIQGGGGGGGSGRPQGPRSFVDVPFHTARQAIQLAPIVGRVLAGEVRDFSAAANRLGLRLGQQAQRQTRLATQLTGRTVLQGGSNLARLGTQGAIGAAGQVNVLTGLAAASPLAPDLFAGAADVGLIALGRAFPATFPLFHRVAATALGSAGVVGTAGIAAIKWTQWQRIIDISSEYLTVDQTNTLYRLAGEGLFAVYGAGASGALAGGLAFQGPGSLFGSVIAGHYVGKHYDDLILQKVDDFILENRKRERIRNGLPLL